MQPRLTIVTSGAQKSIRGYGGVPVLFYHTIRISNETSEIYIWYPGSPPTTYSVVPTENRNLRYTWSTVRCCTCDLWLTIAIIRRVSKELLSVMQKEYIMNS